MKVSSKQVTGYMILYTQHNDILVPACSRLSSSRSGFRSASKILKSSFTLERIFWDFHNSYCHMTMTNIVNTILVKYKH